MPKHSEFHVALQYDFKRVVCEINTAITFCAALERLYSLENHELKLNRLVMPVAPLYDFIIVVTLYESVENIS